MKLTWRTDFHIDNWVVFQTLYIISSICNMRKLFNRHLVALFSILEKMKDDVCCFKKETYRTSLICLMQIILTCPTPNVALFWVTLLFKIWIQIYFIIVWWKAKIHINSFRLRCPSYENFLNLEYRIEMFINNNIKLST